MQKKKRFLKFFRYVGQWDGDNRNDAYGCVMLFVPYNVDKFFC